MKEWLSRLYIQVFIAIILGGLIGFFLPDVGITLQPLADSFIKLIKMLLAPVIFGTIVVGIAKMGNLKEVGRIGVRALIYFEVVSTLALVIGLIVVNVMQPGVGMNIDASHLNGSSIVGYAKAAEAQPGIVGFLMDIIPTTMVDAFAKGAMLQIILLSVLFGLAFIQAGERGKAAVAVIDSVLDGLFRIVAMVMRLAPIGAGAGVAFTISKYGLSTVWSLAYLMLAVYVTSAMFITVVIGSICRWTGFSLVKVLGYFKDEILITFGTCSTEAVMPRMMVKLERLGCEKSVVGLVLPTGYTFNADGTCIYLTMATIFVAQATNTPLGIGDQVVVLGVLLLTSKGSAGVAGAGFVTLAATLSSIHTVPVAGLVLLLGVDRFMNEARAVTNLIGNAVATIAVAKWESAFDLAKAETAYRNRAAVVAGDIIPETEAERAVPAPRGTVGAH
jgi:aerobic C4-dicarboxylate transport protein